VFFGVTKLFQSNHANLRRMMYLFIKEVAETCNPDDVIIVTSSLTKVCQDAPPLCSRRGLSPPRRA
jgi:vesicle coat complex subunit